MHNVFDVEINGADGKTPAREFRVQPLHRYQVTDWEAYNGGRVRVLAENLTLKQANEIATEFGRAHPGSLVNTMEPPHEGSYVTVTDPAAINVAINLKPDGSLPAVWVLRTLPYAVAAALKQAAIKAGSDAVLKLFTEADVAVDVRPAPACADEAVKMSVDDAMSIRGGLMCFNMSTAEIDAALARAWSAGAGPDQSRDVKAGVVTST